MINISDFKINNKYYIKIINATLVNPEIHSHVIINNLIPKFRSDLVDYISLSTLSSSKNFIENCGLNQIDVPLPLIRKVESLYDIFNGVLLNDIIYNINQYL